MKENYDKKPEVKKTLKRRLSIVKALDLASEELGEEDMDRVRRRVDRLAWHLRSVWDIRTPPMSKNIDNLRTYHMSTKESKSSLSSQVRDIEKKLESWEYLTNDIIATLETNFEAGGITSTDESGRKRLSNMIRGWRSEFDRLKPMHMSDSRFKQVWDKLVDEAESGASDSDSGSSQRLHDAIAEAESKGESLALKGDDRNWEVVTKEEFEAYIKSYPRPLDKDVTHLCEPSLLSYNDFSGGRDWPLSMVAKVQLFDESLYGGDKKNIHYITKKK